MLKAPRSPSQTPPAGHLDHSDVSALTDRLMAVAGELAQMTPAVASARVVREFAGDRRKRALALATREFIAGNSATAAEALGRGSIAYGEALTAQERELFQAETALAEHEAKRVMWESLRSSLSMAKTIAGNI